MKKMRAKLKKILFNIKIFILTYCYVFFVLVLLVLTIRFYILDLIDLYVLEVVNTCLHDYMFIIGNQGLELLRNFKIYSISYDSSNILIGNLINCDILSYLIEFQEIKGTYLNMPGTDTYRLAYDSDLNRHYIKICLGKINAEFLVQNCPEIVKTKVENALISKCYCFEIDKNFAIAYEVLKSATYQKFIMNNIL